MATISAFGYTHIQSRPATPSSISGLKKGNLLRIEAIRDGEYHLFDEKILNHPIKSYPLAADDTLGASSRYNLMVAVQKDVTKAPTDISFLVDKETGYIKTSIDGTQQSIKLRIDGEIHTGRPIYRDDGSIEFKTLALNGKENHNICVDIGGFRGSNLTVCHTVKNIETVALKLPSFTFTTPTFNLPSFETFKSNLEEKWDGSFKAMTAQINTVQKQQTAQTAKIMDAKSKKEEARENDIHKAKTYATYNPSKRGCETASQSRGIKPSINHAQVGRDALIAHMKTRSRATGQSSTTARGVGSDTEARLAAVRNDFGNPNSAGSKDFAKGGDREIMGMDVNYHALVGSKKTINADFSDGGNTKDNRAVLAFMDNICNSTPNEYIPPSMLHTAAVAPHYQALRQMEPLRDLACVPIADIISKKFSGPKDNPAEENLRAAAEEQGEQISDRPSLDEQQDFLAHKALFPGDHIKGAGEGKVQHAKDQATKAFDKVKAIHDETKRINSQTAALAGRLELETRQSIEKTNAQILGLTDL